MKVDIKVVNTRVTQEGEYIGRGSPLGNPFTYRTGTKAKYIVASRAEAIEKYKEWIIKKLSDPGTEQYMEMERLFNILLNTGEITLRCFCAPLPCHGDVIKEILLNEIKSQ